MTYTTLCVLLSAAGALFSGPMEAAWVRYRIRRGVGKKLPHATLTAVRLVVGAAYLVGLGLEMNAPPLLWLPTLLACMAVFAPLHRVSFNLAHGQDWRYMGPVLRRDDDSWYDTQWHRIAREDMEYFDHGIHKGKTRYTPVFPDAPFYAATIWELSWVAFVLLLVERWA